ncbi:hypothetical protein [Nocardia salmonicida]|uniref:hypothetical protein n=1 Tax=Nocardia salmonicida TaxID=53431 RepID=UPI002E2A6BC9|nr:hypothetical protein [Nocardia salmonicida]
MLTTVSFVAWLVLFLGFVVVLVSMKRAHGRLQRDMRQFHSATRRLDSAAAATAAEVPATVTPLRGRRTHRVRPLHELDYAEQTARVRRDPRGETH